MHLTHKRVPSDRSTGSEAVPRRNRETAPRPTRARLALVGTPPERERLKSVEAAVGDGPRPVAARPLVVGSGRQGEALIVWLSGTLDRATATVLDCELDARMTEEVCLVVDLTGLAFVDAAGLDALARIHRRATERGDRLSFRHGQHVAQQPRGLIRAAQLRSEWAPRRARPSDEDSYFALAMACADVDHPRLDDRPGAA
jgi:anti-anti-sigma factor